MKRILIAGATSAIAMACARKWVDGGARFALIGRNGERLEAIARDLEARGAEHVSVHRLDMTALELHAETLQACYEALNVVDIALVAHGTLPDQRECETSVSTALREFSNNAVSVIAFLTALAQQMERQGHGTIAVISSVAGDRGRRSNYLYGSAKAAVTAFCEGLRGRLWTAGVHLMTIKPGFVDTPMTRHLDLPRALVVGPEHVAKDIVRGIERGKNTLYTPWFWAWIMPLLRGLPDSIFKRIRL
ncbi:MAG: SDR family oxidoreductase [Burkholderiales bacterium]|nr:SDR family oxidoreductase [Burkholderiales bacterium]